MEVAERERTDKQEHMVTKETDSGETEQLDGHHLEVIRGSEALANAIRLEPPNWRSKQLVKLYGFCIVAFLCSTINGYDGSLMNAILDMHPFQRRFQAGIVGARSGLISGMYTIGGVSALPFVGPALDTYGRRVGMFIGCFFVIVGTIVSGTSQALGQFLGGRFLLGFGFSIAASAGPSYVVEISHPAFRGVLTGLYNCQYYIGSIAAAGCTRGTVGYTNDQSWKIPIWTQMVCAGLVCLFVFLLPESPRWLFSHGKTEEARRFLAKYHGEGNPKSEYVKLQMREFEAEISLNSSDKRFWDYTELFNTHAHRWRVFNMLIVSVSGQWAGNGVVSYYLPAMLKTAGVTNSVSVLNINLGSSFTSAFGAYSGVFFVSRFGRRKTLVGTSVACSIIFACIATGTGIFKHQPHNTSAANAGIVFIFFFGIVYSFGYTPLQALYPVETLSFEQRAKGMALSSASVNAASLLNQFAWPVALQQIGWKTYLIFAVWNLIQGAIQYLFCVETNKRTLEELGEIYASPNPRKASTIKKEVLVHTGTAQIVRVRGIIGGNAESDA